MAQEDKYLRDEPLAVAKYSPQRSWKGEIRKVITRVQYLVPIPALFPYLTQVSIHVKVRETETHCSMDNRHLLLALLVQPFHTLESEVPRPRLNDIGIILAVIYARLGD